MKEKIINIFNQVQNTSSCHQKCLSTLCKIYKDRADEFFDHFRPILTNLLIQNYKLKNEFVNRALEFMCLFLTSVDESDSEESELLSKTLDFLLNDHDNIDEVVRYRSCQILNILFNHMVGGEINDDLCDAVQDAMLERLMDRKTEIRLQAISALHRLQDPSNSNDPIINAYISLISSDPNSKVRKGCIDRVAPTKEVLIYVIERIRDTDEQVRIAAFTKLAKMVKYIKIEDRQKIIKVGFRDPSETVREFVAKKLTVGWLQMYNDNILELLKAVRLDADEEDIKETIFTVDYILDGLFMTQTQKELFDVIPQTNRLIPFEKLNYETVVFWRFLVQKLRENDSYENLLNEVLPELVEFSSYIQQYCKWVSQRLETLNHLEINYILKELFVITMGYDLTDVSSCESLNKLIKTLLLNVEWISEESVKQIIKNLDQSIPDTHKHVRFVISIISELLSPPPSEEEFEKERNRQFEIAKIKVNYFKLQEEQKECIKSEDFVRAAELKKEIEDIKETLVSFENADPDKEENEDKEVKEMKTYDAQKLIKCLDITVALLLSPKITKLTNELRSLKDDVIQDLLIYPIKSIKSKAIKCYSLCSILDRPTAETGIHIFSGIISSYHAGNECDADILISAINGVGDLIVLFGSELVVSPEDRGLTESMNEHQLEIFGGGSSLTSIIQALVDLMDDENPAVQEASGVVLCNLIMSRRIHSSSLLSRMILKWCSPVSDAVETNRLKQLIGRVLEKVPSLPESDKLIEKAFVPTIKVLVQAPRNSPLADVDINRIAKCMLELSYCSQNEAAHNSLAILLCQQLIEKSKNSASIYFSKALLFLRLSFEDTTLINYLLELCDRIRDNVSNKLILNNIIKFTTRLLESSNHIRTKSTNNSTQDDNIEESEPGTP